MNVKRGMFRLWLLGSICWGLFIVGSNWDRIHDPFVMPASYRYFPEQDVFVELGDMPNYPVPEPAKSNTYELYYKTVFYAPADVPISQMGAKFMAFFKTIEAERSAIVWAARWKELRGLAVVVIGFPLVVLLAGWALLWALSGFRKA